MKKLLFLLLLSFSAYSQTLNFLVPGADIVGLLDNTPIKLDFANTTTLRQQTCNGGAPVTAVTTNGDAIGTVYSLGPGGLFVRHIANTNKSDYQGDATRGGYARFLTNDTPLDNPSTEMRDVMRFVHASSPSYRAAVWIKRDAASTVIDIWSTKDNASSTSAGTLIRGNGDASGTLFVRGGNGSSMILNNTGTTTTLAIADGWTALFWDQSGTAFRIGKNAIPSEAITASGAGADVTAGGGLAVGGTTNAGGGGHSISYFVMEAGTWDATGVAAFMAHDPDRNQKYWASQRVRYDYTTDCYSDVSMTVPTTNGGNCRRVKNQFSIPLGTWAVHGQAASDAASPLLTTNLNNSKSAGVWDGTGNQLLTFNGGLVPDNGGAYHLYIVAQNLDATSGMHVFLETGGGYYVWTGENHNGTFGPPPPPKDYHTTHSTGGVTGEAAQMLKNLQESINITGLTRQWGDFNHWNGNLVAVPTSSSDGRQNWGSSGGSAQGALWYYQGYQFFLEVYFGHYPSTYDIAEIQRIQSLFTGL